jgi:hypothetical protein
MLIESHGPCWFYGTGSEHTVLYQYQLYKAKNVRQSLTTSRHARNSACTVC